MLIRKVYFMDYWLEVTVHSRIIVNRNCAHLLSISPAQKVGKER